MKQPALMINNYLFWKDHDLRHTWSGCRKEQWYLWLEHSVCMVLLADVAGLFQAYPFGLVMQLHLLIKRLAKHPVKAVSRWENLWWWCLKSWSIKAYCLYYCCSFFLQVTESLERSNICIFLQSKQNPSPVVDIEKGPLLLEVMTGWHWENA